jgi:hypothetical protein
MEGIEEAIDDAPAPNPVVEPNAPIPNADPDPMMNTLSALAHIPAMLRPFTSNTSLTQLEGIQNADEREAALLAAGNVYSYSESDAAIANSREVCFPTAIFSRFYHILSNTIMYHLILSQITPYLIIYQHVTISHYMLADPRAVAAHQCSPQHPFQDPVG